MVYSDRMATDKQPTINDFLARLYTIRDESAARAGEAAKALTAGNAAKGLLRSGATLKGLARLIEGEFDKAFDEMLVVLRHMRSVPGIDYQVCRDQAFLRARDLIPVLRGAADLEKWFDMIDRGDAAKAIEKRLQALYGKIDYRFRQFDVGLDQAGATRLDTMTPTATRLQQRLNDRRAWFQNEWFFKWHHIGGGEPVEIDQFNGRLAHYGGIQFSGSVRDVYWESIARGLRKEIVDQFAWIEASVKGYDRSVAVDAIDQCAGALTSFARTIRRLTIEKDRILRGDGVAFPEEQDLGHWDGSSDEEISDQAEAVKSALFPPIRSVEPTSPATAPVSSTLTEPASFQVALSFAGEQRDYVREVAKALSARHIAVFYDEFQANELWGKDGAEYFHQVYSRDARYVVMFISSEYVVKAWTRQERRSAISRQIKSDAEYILPVRFDDAEVPGLPDTTQYLTASRYTPAELAVEIARKIGVAPMAGKASDVPPPASRAMSGEVSFDYGAFDGRYVIGHGATMFETCWSKANDVSIHLTNDPPSINGVAIAKGAAGIDRIGDASSYDFTSRVRTVRTGEIAVLRNVHGFYAAIEILRVDDDRLGAPSDALTMRYRILADGAVDFTPRHDEAATA